jgi:hypothetical protein
MAPDPNEPAMVVIAEYYRQTGKRPDIIALPALLAFVRWTLEQEGK